MVIEIKPTDSISFTGGVPRPLLESFIANDSEAHRNACLTALSQVVKSKGKMTIPEESCETLCDLFEALIKHFIDHPEDDCSGPWGGSKSVALLDAYLFATEQFHSSFVFGPSGVREAPTWLPRAVMFLVTCQHTTEEKAVYEETNGLKQVLHYAQICGGVQLDGYLASCLEKHCETLRKRSHRITQEEWNSAERVLRFLVANRYFPLQTADIVHKLRKLVVGKDRNHFVEDREFGPILWRVALLECSAVVRFFEDYMSNP